MTGLTLRGGLVLEHLAWSPGAVTYRLSAVPGTAWLRPRGTRLTVGTATGAEAARPEVMLDVPHDGAPVTGTLSR